MSLEDRILAAQRRLHAEQAQHEKDLLATEAEVEHQTAEVNHAVNSLANETANLFRIRAERQQVELEIEAILLVDRLSRGEV